MKEIGKHVFFDMDMIDWDRSEGTAQIEICRPHAREMIETDGNPYGTVINAGSRLIMWAAGGSAMHPRGSHSGARWSVMARRPMVGPRWASTVVYDPRSETFVCIYNDKERGLMVTQSEDGFNDWTPPVLIFAQRSDTVNAMWDTRLKKYVLYFRQWDHEERSVVRVEVDRLSELRDLERTDYPDWWQTKEGPPPITPGQFPVAMSRGDKDVPGDIYNFPVSQLAHDEYYAFPSFYAHVPWSDADVVDGKWAHVRREGYLDIQLAVSRDGINWTRFPFPYINHAVEGIDCGCLMAYQGIVAAVEDHKPPLDPGRMMFYSGHATTHSHLHVLRYGDEGEEQGLFRARFYRDRLAGLAAGPGTTITTRPFWVPENADGRLMLNYSASATGEVRAVLQASTGKEIAASKRPMKGNAVSSIVEWDRPVEIRGGDPVRLQFKMHNSTLHSWEFGTEERA